jgi:uncharacterized protein YcgL (UPF0745 family)
LLYRRSSAFIGGPYLVLIFALGQEKKWPLMNADKTKVRSFGSSRGTGTSTCVSRTSWA